MELIVDASVALKWVVDEVDSELALSLLRFEIIVPDLLFSECSNALWKLTHRSLISADTVFSRLDSLDATPMTVVQTRKLASRALAMSLELAHPCYDMFYLAAAEDHGIQVVTVDRRLLGRVSKSRFAHLAVSLQDAAAN